MSLDLRAPGMRDTLLRMLGGAPKKERKPARIRLTKPRSDDPKTIIDRRGEPRGGGSSGSW